MQIFDKYLKAKGIRQKARRFFTYALCLFTFAFLTPFNVKASDPVTVIVSLSPPYTPFLHEYGSSGTDKLQVSLIVNDSRMVNYPAKMQMFIEHIGSGIVMRTSEYAAIAPILLTGNVAEVLNGFDLYKYFLAQNNVFSGFDQNQYLQTGRIPDGQYRIGFRLVDAQRTDVVLSNTAYTQPGWFLLNDPPLINLPQNKEEVRVNDLQNVKLEWFPRHLGSLNGAFATSYQIELFAIRVPGMNPNQAAMSMQPDFTDVTNRTSFLLTSDRYPLEPGIEYAFRIKAVAGDGQLTLFHNNGYSEVSSFIYGSLCPEPENVSAQTRGPDKLEITWDTDPLQTSFETRFRTAGQQNDAWHTRESFAGTAEIANVLSPGIQYEYQVKAACTTVESDYSALGYFTLPPPASNFECGADDSVTVSNTSPKISLQAGEMIFYGQFPVKLTEVSGNNGIFTGKGRMRIPFLASIQVNMQFTDIKVNELNEVYEGELVSIYNPNSTFLIDDVTDYFAEGDQIGNIIEGVDSAAITLGFPVDNASSLTVVVSGNSVTVSSGGQSVSAAIDNTEEGTTVQDSEGKLYAVDKNGDVSLVGKTVPEGKTQAAASSSFLQNRFDSDIQLSFENAGKWAFDAYDDVYAGSTFAQEYETVDGRVTPWKFVPIGKSDKVSAKLTKGSIDLSKITFRTPAGTEFYAQEKGGTLEISLIGARQRDGYELFALYEENDSTTRTIGKLNIASYPLLERHLTIVPMQQGSVSASSIETALNAIYKPYGISWTVTVDNVFADRTWDADNNGLKATGTEFYSAFTDEMRALNATYTAQRGIDDKSVYLFWFAEKADGAENILGDMPLDSRFGYIFSPTITSKTHQTIAHELGHGMFQLRHTFSSKYNIAKNATRNLMDYAGGTELTKYQWDVLFDAQNLLATWAQKESEGAAYFSHREYAHLIIEEFRKAYLQKKTVKLSLPHEFNLFSSTPVSLFDDKDGDLEIWDGDERHYTDVSIDATQKINPAVWRDNNNVLIYGIGSIKIRIDKKNQERFENYLFPSSEQERTAQLQSAVDQISSSISNEDLEYILSAIPQSDYSLISFEKRKLALEKLMSSYVNTSGPNDVNEEMLVINLINGQEHTAKFYSYFSDEETSFRFYNTIKTHRSEFVYQLALICRDNWTEEAKNEAPTIILGISPEGVRYNLSGCAVWEGESNAFCINNIKDHGGSDHFLSKLVAKPLEPVKLISFNGEINYVPAALIQHLYEKEEYEEWKTAFFRYLNGLGLSSAGRMLLCKTSPKIIQFISFVEFSKTGIDALMLDEAIKIQLRAEGYEWFVDNWQSISLKLDIATLGSEFLLNFAKNGGGLSLVLRKNGKIKAADEVDDITEEAIRLTNAASDDIFAQLSKRFPEIGDDVLDNFIQKIKTLDDDGLQLLKDFSTLDAELLALLKKPQLVESWKVLSDAGYTASKADIPTLIFLNKVDEIGEGALKTKLLSKLDDAELVKFSDDFEGAADQTLTTLKNNEGLIDYWKANNHTYSVDRPYPSSSNINWEDTRQAIIDKGNKVEIKVLNALDEQFLINPPSSSGQKVMAAAYCDELGGEVEFAYNLTKGEKASFDYTKLDPVIKDHIDFLNMVRNDAILDGNLYSKVYGGSVPLDKIIAAGDAASHAEILAMDKVIKRMRSEDLFTSRKDIDKIYILVRGKEGWDNMPRCPHCFHLSPNAKTINNH